MFHVPLLAHARAMEDMPAVRLQSLDKITARTRVFESNVGEIVKFGDLYVKTQACRKAPPFEQPESAAFLQIWEPLSDATHKGAPKSKWVFSGWMFSSSPGLSYMDHPIYDVWVLDCVKKAKNQAEVQDSSSDTQTEEGVISELLAPAQPLDVTDAVSSDAPLEGHQNAE